MRGSWPCDNTTNRCGGPAPASTSGQIMDRRRLLVLLCGGVFVGAAPAALAKDGSRNEPGSDSDHSGSGKDRPEEDDRSGSGSDASDHGGSGSSGSGSGGSGAGGSGSGGSGSGESPSGGSGGSGHGSLDGEGADRPGRGAEDRATTSADVVALAYRGGESERIGAGSYVRRDARGRIVERRRATSADLRRLTTARAELRVLLDSRTGAVETIDRRGWRERMQDGTYILIDPKGRVVRSRAIRSADLARIRKLTE